MTHTGDFNHIKDWLLPIVDEKGLSLEQVARAAGLSKASIYHYINDKRRPSTDAMRKICDVLGVPHEDGLKTFSPKANGRPKGAY
jgi:transcriptional regulator with XRE-family HTH domain